MVLLLCVYIKDMWREMINKTTKHLSQIKSDTKKNKGRKTKNKKKKMWIKQSVSGKTSMIFLHFFV